MLKLARVASDTAAAFVLAMQASDIGSRAVAYFRVTTVWALKETFSRLQCRHGHPDHVAAELRVVEKADEGGQNHWSRAHRTFDRGGERRLRLRVNK